MRYSCYYVSGGGTEYDAGIWEKKETAKTLTFQVIDKPDFFATHWDKIKVNKYYRDGKEAWRNIAEPTEYLAYMNNGHVIRCWPDGTYTAYPDQCGTPHVFEPLEKSPEQK